MIAARPEWKSFLLLEKRGQKRLGTEGGIAAQKYIVNCFNLLKAKNLCKKFKSVEIRTCICAAISNFDNSYLKSYYKNKNHGCVISISVNFSLFIVYYIVILIINVYLLMIVDLCTTFVNNWKNTKTNQKTKLT
ncbi:hypothetical protein [Chryseobacterium sp.]|uniref:hypothetical protein n=1 Tax=Chryseobacterium sp. TaxID=1871047 RepID=UPI002FC7AC57